MERRNGKRRSKKKSGMRKDSVHPKELPLTPDFLQAVASKIPTNKWKAIFRGLMSTPESDTAKPVDVMISDIEHDYPNDAEEQRYQALLRWKSDSRSPATWAVLARILDKHGLYNVYVDLNRYSQPATVAAAEPAAEHMETDLRQQRHSSHPPIQVMWEVDKLIVKEGTAERTTALHMNYFLSSEPQETKDRVSIADAMLISIVDPLHSQSSNVRYHMELDKVKTSFSKKFGETVAFDDLRIGDIRSFVSNTSRRLELTKVDRQLMVQERIEPLDDQSQGSVHLSDNEPDEVDIDSVTGSDLAYYETASDMSDPRGCPVSEIRSEDLQRLTSEVEGSLLMFKTEADYAGEEGGRVFSRDVVALWNKPRKPTVSAHIIVGVKTNTSPPHDLHGLEAANILDDDDYQKKFQAKSFVYKPRFRYYEVQYMGKVFGVVAIASAEGFGQVCYATDTCEYWNQNCVLVREGSRVTFAHIHKYPELYSYVLSVPALVSPPQKHREHEDKAWECFLKRLDIENHRRHSFCLLTSRCSPETPNLECVGCFPWDRVWDFDPDSCDSGLLSKCGEETQSRFSVRTCKDFPQTTSPVWLLVRGMRKREDTLALGSAKQWAQTVGAPLNAQCDQLCKLSESRPLIVIVLWYGNGDCIRHLHKALGKIDEHQSGVTYIICMQNTPSDMDGYSTLTELCKDLEIATVVEIPLERLCSGLSDLPCCKKVPTQSLELPGKAGAGVSIRDSQWLQQELDVLFLGKCYGTDVQPANGETFYRGGNLTWHEMEIAHFDAERTILHKLTIHLRKCLSKGVTCNVTLFHEPGSGGTSLCRRILWELHAEFPCACATSDVLDPHSVLQRLEFLSHRTSKPLLLLVDDQEPMLVQELLENRDICMVVLSVHRYPMKIKDKVPKGNSFWLMGEVDGMEATRFNVVFSKHDLPKATCRPTNKKLQQMVEDVQKTATPHYVYEFGLALYNTDYTGLRSYVDSYLGLKGELTSWQIAVTYLALACYCGHKKIPCQFFSTLFNLKESGVVKADAVLTHMGKQFVLENDKECTWQITYYAVAKEILEQVLTRKQSEATGKQLSKRARKSLKDLAKEFLTYAASIPRFRSYPSTVMKLVQNMFIRRSWVDPSPDQCSKREPLSRLVCDIPSPDDQLELMKHLVNCFQGVPTFAAHLGRAYMYNKNFELAQHHLSKARALRLEEMRASNDPYSGSHYEPRQGGSEPPDSLLSTIEHQLGINCHEQIKDIIGGGQQGKDNYKFSPRETVSKLTDIQKTVQAAISHFSNCRRHFTKGMMNASYGYLGEIKVRLHIADFVAKRYRQGYYGFLESNCSHELKQLVESCFSCTARLLGEYQHLILIQHQSVSEADTSQINKYQDWFNTIFDDADSALRRWEGRNDVDSLRNMIAAFKLKYRSRGQAKKNDQNDTFRSFLETIEGEDLKCVKQLYETIFKEAYERSVRTDLSSDLREWLAVIRSSHLPGHFSISEVVLPHVRRCHDVYPEAVVILYYLYVLNVVVGLQNQRFEESCGLLEKLKVAHASRSQQHQRRWALEWLGSESSGSNIGRLVGGSSLGEWDKEKSFWKAEWAQRRLQVCTGIITKCSDPKHCRITLNTGVASPSAGSRGGGSLQVVYSPRRSGLCGERYLNVEVEFYVGFTVQNGAEAYNVELKHPCENTQG